MSTTIDNKVVEMRFDNKQFEKNVSTTLSTLEKLKQKLNLSGASKGLQDVSSAAKNFKMDGMGSAVDSINTKFSALQVMAVTALANITNSAVNAGKRIASALTIEPITSGFQEYETQINAVQTILANTKSKGSTLDDVNNALDELNTYADKTIYNFTEMTRNIGTFTAAGVDLETSVSSIKGIANLAAVSGSTSLQASTAMYQLSQALAAGKVQLMDWNSVVNAGMGGQVFQDALKRTATQMGYHVDDLIKKYGSFRESLTKGEWLTADVLTETLTQLSGAYTEADLLVKGYSKEQVKEILDLADTAVNAATKVKTFTQLWDTLKEAAQSGWTQSWEIIIGDFEEAKKTLTQVSDTIGDMIGKSADARNKVLQGWKDLGGRTALIDSIKNAFDGVMGVVTPIQEAFHDIFPPITAKRLFGLTEGFRDLTSKLILSDENADKLKRTFQGVFSVMDIFGKAVGAVGKAFVELLGSEGVARIGQLFLDATASVGDFFTSINEGLDTGGLSGGLSKAVSGISDVLKSAADGLSGFGAIFTSVGNGVTKAAGNIWNAVKTVFTWISDNVSAGDIFASLAGSGIFVLATKLGGAFDKVKESANKVKNIVNDVLSMFKSNEVTTIKENFCNILDSVHGSLVSFTTGIRTTALVSIGVAVGILSSSLKTLSELKRSNIEKALSAIGTMLVMLGLEFRSLTKSIKKFDSNGIVKSGFALMMVAKAVGILSDVMIKLSSLSWDKIGKGLAGVGGGLLELVAGLKIIGKTNVSFSTSVAMLALAKSCDILGDAFGKFGSMSWGEIGRGLAGMGGALAEVAAVSGVLGKLTGLSGILGSKAIFIGVQGLGDLADALKNFGELSWGEIGHGLTGMGGALAEVATVSGALGKLTGLSGILGSGAILLGVQGLGDLAEAFGKIGSMVWGDVKSGLVGMGGALAEVAVVSGALGKLAGFSGILGSGAILVGVQGLGDLAEAFATFGSMTWAGIERGLKGMGGALAEVAVVSGALGKLTGLSGILGSGAILLGVQGLGDLAEAFGKFAGMTWAGIERGLEGMGGALAEIGVVSGALGKLAGFSGILGSGTILLSIQGLSDLADVLKKFGYITSWEGIKRGLVGMGGALAEVGVVSGALGKLAGLSGILGSGAILLGVQGLGDLAEAFKKFGEMQWDEIGHGLAAMGGALSEIALGGLLNTLSILGDLAIAKVAEPLGVLADSVKKWSGVTVPEGLGDQLGILATGVKAFTFGGFGADAIAEVAAPLGVLADSVKKWTGIIIPENLRNQLRLLATGVEDFMFAGFGAGAIAATAEPLGTLAGSVKKWTDITIMETLGSQLKSLAEGIKAFSWAFMGGLSIGTVVGPLGSLAGSISKWKDVTVPDKLDSKLKSLADGVKSFSFAFAGGLSIGAINGPLGTLAGAVKKWNGVAVPANLADNLTGLADGVKKFAGIGDISSAVQSVGSITSSITKLSGVDFQAVTSGISGLSGAFKKLSNIDTSGLASLDSAASSVGEVAGSMSKSVSKFSSVGTDMASSVIKGLKSKQSSFQMTGTELIARFIAGISSQADKVKTTMTSAVSSAASAVRGYRSSFYSAGSYLGSGLVLGIASKKSAVYKKSYELGQEAVRGEKDGQKSNSPSKLTIQAGKWLGEGLVIGMDKMASRVYGSGRELGSLAVESMSSAISQVSDFVGSGIDAQPVIRPVLDLSDVETKASAIGGMFNDSTSVRLATDIGASMNQGFQNASTNDDVISAIKGLQASMAAAGGGNTYNINGVTYDDGSNITSAIETIVRAARIERRV